MSEDRKKLNEINNFDFSMINVHIYSRRKLIIRSHIIIISVQFGNYNSFMFFFNSSSLCSLRSAYL